MAHEFVFLSLTLSGPVVTRCSDFSGTLIFSGKLDTYRIPLPLTMQLEALVEDQQGSYYMSNESNGFHRAGLYKFKLPTTSSVGNMFSQEVDIYPNPARDRIHVKNSEAAFFEMRCLNGKRILTTETNIIRFLPLPPGIYMLSGYDQKGAIQFCQKLMITPFR